MAGRQTAAAPEVPATKVSAQSGRRRFTAEYKASIVQHSAQCRAPVDRRAAPARRLLLGAAYAVTDAVSARRAARVVAATQTHGAAAARRVAAHVAGSDPSPSPRVSARRPIRRCSPGTGPRHAPRRRSLCLQRPHDVAPARRAGRSARTAGPAHACPVCYSAARGARAESRVDVGRHRAQRPGERGAVSAVCRAGSLQPLRRRVDVGAAGIGDGSAAPHSHRVPPPGDRAGPADDAP